MSFTIKQLGLVRAFARRFGAGRPERRVGVRPSLRLVELEDRSVPANFVVTSGADSGAGTLRDAINTANGNNQDDTITFSGVNTVALTSGELKLNNDTRLVTIDGGSGITITRSGTTKFRIFNFDNSVQVLIKSVTISSGSASFGGGINIEGSSTLTLNNTNVQNCSATSGVGGGIYAHLSSKIAFISSTITGNVSSVDGGGVYLSNSSSIEMKSTVVTNNTSASHGGGLFLAGPFAITTSNISNNSASANGGGVYITPGLK